MDLALDHRDLTQEILPLCWGLPVRHAPLVRSGRLTELSRVPRTDLIHGQTDKVQGIFDFVRQTAGQLTQGREALEPIEFLLALACAAQLRDDLVETARQQSDFIAPAHLRHRLQPARGDILGRRRNKIDRPRVAISQHIGKHDADREDYQGQSYQPGARLPEQFGVVAEIRDHLNVTHQMVLDDHRDQINGAFARHRDQVVGSGAARVGPQMFVDYHLLGAGIERSSDQFGVGAVDDQVLAGGNRYLQALVVEAADVVLQPFTVGAADGGQFLYADLDRTREVFDVLPRGVRDRLLRAQADDHLGAERGRQQDHDN